MRIVIKVGTSTLTHKTGQLNIRRMESICKTISDLMNQGNEIVLVSSGAIGMGASKIGKAQKPEDMATKQACASIGQCRLMYGYDRNFSEYNHTVSQILLTNSDIEDEERRNHFKNTCNRLIELGVIPIINENDTVSTAEIEIGDNDTLGAIVAKSIKADLLIVLSDIEGLYTKDPRKNCDAKLLKEVKELNEEIISMAGGSGTSFGTGGMATKLNAAKITMEAGIDLVLANGKRPEILYDILEGKQVGTKFIGKKLF